MLWFSLILICLFGASLADISCSNGFKPLNNRKCIKIFSNSSSHADAVATCSQNNGHLVSISNAIDNNAIAQLAGSSSTPLWIGLKCQTNNVAASCFWDDGTGSAQTFNNFVSGYPLVDIGTCVYMLTSGGLAGKWISGNSDVTMSFVCEAPPFDPVNSQCDFKFNGSCYFPTLSALSTNEAQFACQQNCKASLVSIHSIEENTFIESLFGNNIPPYVRIGAQFLNNQFNWIDNSSWNYANIGYSNPNLGNCLSMALKDDIVPASQWISSRCETQLPFICKRPIDSQCAPTAAPPTASPAQCKGIHVFDNSGTVYSPNYPNIYLPQSGACTYLFDTPIGTNVQIQFPVLILDQKSSISLYNQLEDTKPFLVLEGSSSSSTWFNSTSNTLKLIFRACLSECDMNQNYKWQANFKPSFYSTIPPPVTITANPNNPSGCNSTILSAPGTISSPSYPNNYPNNVQCLYHLSTQGGYRIRIDFKVFRTEKCCDIAVIHDGPYLSSPELGRLSGDLPDDSEIFQSSSNSMLVSFTSDANDSEQGFLAYYASF